MAGNDKRASEDQLDELHQLIAVSFTEQIKKAKETEDGIPASLLANAAKFLKDNGVDRAMRSGDPLDTLAGELPDLEDQDYG